jgi:hypothetical protein
VARGNEGWPRSAARQGMASSFRHHGGVAAHRQALSQHASTGRLDGMGERKVSGRAGRAHSSREGVSGAARQQAQRAAAAQRAYARARSSACTLRIGVGE